MNRWVYLAHNPFFSPDEETRKVKIQTLNSLYLPPKEEADKLILVLHGRGDSYEGFTWLPKELGISNCHYLMVNAPDEWYGGYSWYDMDPHQAPGIIRSRRVLDQLFEELYALGFTSENILIFGFSQGCLMALEWGARHHHTLLGVVGVSGYCYDPKALSQEATLEGKKTKWLVTHGYEDQVLPYLRSEAQIDHLNANGFDIEFIGYHKGHTIDPYKELPKIREFISGRIQ